MRGEEADVGVIAADRSAGRMHCRPMAKDDIEGRNADVLLPRPVPGALGAAACGDPGAAPSRLRARCGQGRPAMRATWPRCLHLPPPRTTAGGVDGAAEWMYQTMLARSRETSGEQGTTSASGAERPGGGEQWFASIQHVPDTIRDDAVGAGPAAADKSSGKTIARY